jgi:hypothetical protein
MGARERKSPPMRHCGFCGLGSPRRTQFFTGLQDVAICDCCLEVAVELAKPGGWAGDPDPTSNGCEAGTCRFCGQERSECGPGGHAGGGPDMFICNACKRLGALELDVT